MPTHRALDRHRSARRRPAGGAAVRAIVLALAGTALAAGPHHATTDSAVSRPAPLVAAVALGACAYPALRSEARRASTVAVTAAQALLPGWLQLTGAEVPAARLDDHPRLPAAWHHQPPAMAALNLLAGLALILLVRGSAGLPARPTYAAAGTARHWWTYVPYAISLIVRRTDVPLPMPRRIPRPAVALPRPHALVALLHRAQPCAP
ncbi:hypothetical protein [Streptomyces sp. R44]|uniref:Integral membrane protein n=1 Tax=Streptomyces sp. R44 TaxID=3238633 RepID=A0AB39SNA3_9ACTN